MSDLLLLVYPLLLIVMALRGASLSPRGERAASFLCLDQTRQIRAAACLCVILHHMTQRITGYGSLPRGPITFFNYAGFLFTGIFFFFSGFGLMQRLRTRKDYLRTFPARRFPSVLVPFWITNLLLLAAGRILYGYRSSPGRTFSDLFGLTLVNSNGWFIIEIVLFYFLFWILFSRIRNRDAALVLLSLLVLLTIGISFFRGHDPNGMAVHWFRGEWWYNSTLVFIAGLIFGRFRDRIEAFALRTWPFLLVSLVLLYAVTFRVSVRLLNRYGYYQTDRPFGMEGAALTLLAQSLAAVFFALLVVLLSMKITLRSRTLVLVSGVSLELFLLHGSFIDLVFSGLRLPAMALFGLVFLSSIAAAALTVPLTRRASRALTDLLSGPERESSDETLTLERQNMPAKRKARREALKKGVLVTVLAIVLFLLVSRGRRLLLAGRECQEELSAIRSARAGDEVLFGWFEQDGNPLWEERLTWILLKKEDGRACLITRDGIAGSFYNRRHEAVTWEESDLYALLSTDLNEDIFSSAEAECLVPADEGFLTLLSVREAESLFPDDQSRELAISAAARHAGTNINEASKHHGWDMKGYRSSWWWLKGEPGVRSDTAPIVTVDGTIETESKEVNRPGGAVRPVIWVRY